MGHSTNITCKLSTSMIELSCSRFGKAFRQVPHRLAGTENKTKQTKKRLWAAALMYTQKYLHHITHHLLSLHNHNLLLCKCFFTTKTTTKKRGHDLGHQTCQIMSCVSFVSNSIICFKRLDWHHHRDRQSKNNDAFFRSAFLLVKKGQKGKEEEDTKGGGGRGENGGCWRAVVLFFSSPLLHGDGLTEGSLGRGEKTTLGTEWGGEKKNAEVRWTGVNRVPGPKDGSI